FDDFDRRRIPAGRLSNGAARVVPSDHDAVGICVSDCQHARADSRDYLRRACEVFSHRAPFHCAEGGGAVDFLAPARRARCLCFADADPGVQAAEEGVGMRRTLFMMWKEILELRQDPRIFSIIFIAPIIQLTILGYAATTDVRNVPIVIVDADRTPSSQAL